MNKYNIGKSGYAVTVAENLTKELNQELTGYLSTLEFPPKEEYGVYGKGLPKEILGIVPQSLQNLIIYNFIEYCKVRPDFIAESKYVLGEAYLDYILRKERGELKKI